MSQTRYSIQLSKPILSLFLSLLEHYCWILIRKRLSLYYLLVSAIHQDQSSADDLIEQLSFDYLLLVASAQDVLTRRKILQHKVQKRRAVRDRRKNKEDIGEEMLDKQGTSKEVNGSTSKVFSPEKDLEDLEIAFDTMSQVIRNELEHFDSMMIEEFQKEFSAYNSNYFNLIDRSRADTSLSMVKEQDIISKDVQ